MTAAERLFSGGFEVAMNTVHQNAIDKKFVAKGKSRNDGELIALAHSELSEALDFIRHGNPASDHIPEFSGAEEELADTVIRCMDHAAERGWKLGAAIVAKMRFNAGRPIKHGGKKF